MMSSTATGKYCLFVFGVIGVLAASAVTYDYVMDDALITLRYSEHFAASGLPIWNDADAANPTMGYTSPLWMTVNTLTGLFTTDKDTEVLFAKIYSLLAVLSLLVFVSRWVISAGYSIGRGLFLIFLLFWNPVIGLHVNSGMETVLFCVLVFTFAYLIISDKNYFLVLGIGFLCYLTRPEGGLLVLVFWFWDLLQNRRIGRSLYGALLLGLGLFVYHFALWRFYGDVVPNAYYAKLGTGSLVKMAAVKDSIMFLVFSALPLLIISLVRVRLVWARVRIVFIFQVVLFLFFLTVKPLMNVAYRYQLPILFLLYLTTLISYREFAKSKIRIKVAVYALIGFQWIFNLGVTDMYAKKTGRAAQNLRKIGRVLRQKNDHEHWIAYHDAGFVCFYSDFNTIDLIGLNNSEIAKGLVTREEVLASPQVAVVLANAEFPTGQEIEPRLDAGAFGLSYVGSVPMTRDSRKQVVVQFYTRDAFVVPEDLSKMETNPDYDKSWFEAAYYLGRRIVKNR
jgi:arabinofuranosyltransferase